MYLDINLPKRLFHRHIDYPSPALTCMPSHTATALSSADQTWRSLLIDANFRLNHHLSDMRTVSEQLLTIDEDLGQTLNTLH